MTRLENLYKGGVMDKPPTEKKCCDCEVVKPLNEFRKERCYRDGRLKRCRACEKKRVESLKVKHDAQYFEHDKYYSF